MTFTLPIYDREDNDILDVTTVKLSHKDIQKMLDSITLFLEGGLDKDEFYTNMAELNIVESQP